MVIGGRVTVALRLMCIAIFIALLPANAESRSEDERRQQVVATLAGKGDLERVREMISADKNLVNSKDGWGDLALNLAIRSRQRDTVWFLVENGADLSLTGARGYTPLHEAVESGNIEFVRLLLQKGADPSSKGASHEPPLHRLQNDPKIAKLLIQHGADVRQKGICDNTLLHWCAERGADDLSALLILSGADPNARNELGETPLHLALGFGRVRQARSLLEAGAEITDSEKWPALHYAAASGNVFLIARVISEGANLNGQDAQGNTALHVAVSLYGKDNAIELLVAKGARLDVRNQAGKTPLDLARERNPRASQIFEKLGVAE